MSEELRGCSFRNERGCHALADTTFLPSLKSLMPLLQLERPRVFKDVKEAPMLLLLVILLADIAFNWLYINFYREAFSVPGIYTRNVVEPLFILSAFKLGFIVVGLAYWIGRFRHYHLGISKKNFYFALLTAFFLWSIMQLVQIIDGLVTQGRIGYLNTVDGVSTVLVIASFLLLAAGKAFFDEVTYRGILLPQLHLKLQHLLKLPDRVVLGIALLVSQIVYVIIQIPLISLVHANQIGSTVTITSLFFMSILNSLVYLRTKNLYIPIAIHTLWFIPLFVITPTIPHTLILGLSVILFIALWPMLPNSPSLAATWPLANPRRQ